MTNSIKIFSSGGSVAVGNAVQGDRNDVNATVSPVVTQQHFKHASARVSELGRMLQRPESEIQSVVEQMRQLKLESNKSPPDVAHGSALLRRIRENFGWAYPLTKDFLSVAWPALLSIMAT
jgi:hypothetical protein